MPRIVFFLIFLCVAILIIFGMNYFVYTRIKSVFSPSEKFLSILRYLLIGLNCSFIIGILLSRIFHFYLIFNFSFYWLGFLFSTFGLILLIWIIGFIIPHYRFQLLSGVLIFSCLVFGYSIYKGGQKPIFKTISINHHNINLQNKGFSIIHLSDLHINNSQRDNKNMEYIVSKVNQANPDLIVMTGDILDENINPEYGLKDTLKKLKAKYGTYVVTGNHEFYNGVEELTGFFKDTNIQILRNNKISITDNIYLLGIDDPEILNTKEYLKGKDHIFKDLKEENFNILLYHRPNLFNIFTGFGVDLQLSGHTHAGQIFPMDLIVKFIYKYPWGLYQEGTSYIYTSCGTGVWGPKMRTFSRSEIVKIVLDPLN